MHSIALATEDELSEAVGLRLVEELRARKRLIVANGTSERPDTVMTMAGV
jgi:hypothetical protein